MFTFTLKKRNQNTRARTGVFTTPHGELFTPELAIVATEGEIRCIPQLFMPLLPCRYLIINTFHLFTKNIIPTIQRKKGIHAYMRAKDKVVASDSGGFQVFSLGFGTTHGVGKVASIFPEEIASPQKKNIKNDVICDNDADNIVTITDDEVHFPYDGDIITLNPQKSIELQHDIGADIIFAFDECTSPFNSENYTRKALERTHRWIGECIKAHKGHEEKQALFAVVQGGAYRDLRIQAAHFIAQQDVPGFGIGGSLGKTKDDMNNILDWVIPYLPDEKPRHLLGIGQVKDIFNGVRRGVDLFDCVIPTREARHRVLYTHHGRIMVKKRQNDPTPLLNAIPLAHRTHFHEEITSVLENTTWSELFYLFQIKNPTALFIATLHNVCFFAHLMYEIRQAITTNTLDTLEQRLEQYYF